MHAAQLFGNLQDPAVQQFVRLLQHIDVHLNRENPMVSLSRGQGQPSGRNREERNDGEEKDVLDQEMAADRNLKQ